jgi:hypothetical protein
MTNGTVAGRIPITVGSVTSEEERREVARIPTALALLVGTAALVLLGRGSLRS